MARTRATKTSAGAAKGGNTTLTPTTSQYELAAASENPPNLFIIPKRASADARVVTLPHPRNGKPTRYLVCPESGIYEFTRIAAPRTTPRSWLVEEADGKELAVGGGDVNSSVFSAQVVKGADLYLASPIDPLFIVLPALVKQGTSKVSESEKRQFLSSDDHLDSLLGEGHLSEIMRWGEIRKIVEGRISAVCDTMSLGDESMFRVNESKLLKEILAKARRMSEGGLPKSMEDKFVTKALEAPIMSIRSRPIVPAKVELPSEDDGATSQQTESTDSQSSVPSLTASASTLSQASTAATSVQEEPDAEEIVAAMTASEEVIQLQRLSVAFEFICSTYVPRYFAIQLKAALDADGSSVNLKPLKAYQAELVRLKQESSASRASDYSRKRVRDEEEDERAEKKRKKDEEEKRKKANESKGVRDLKKVNTKGMMKLSEFFKKK